jgi:mono/diheme cytochrome c family protein
VELPVVSGHARRARLAAAALSAGLLLAAGVLLAGCGATVGYSEGTGDRAHGKELFTQKCGSCHVLADAGTKGTIGPDLDYAFLQSRRDGLGDETITQVVRGQIAYPVTETPTGAPGMPADIVEGQDAEDVATYVASVAGVGEPSASGGGAPATTPAPSPPEQGGNGGEGAAPAEGKDVFASAGCGSCHTLADAGSSGTVGPNLDDAKPDDALVTDRVTNGQGAMPSFKGQLSEDEIVAVAAYVSSVAGK